MYIIIEQYRSIYYRSIYSYESMHNIGLGGGAQQQEKTDAFELHRLRSLLRLVMLYYYLIIQLI